MKHFPLKLAFRLSLVLLCLSSTQNFEASAQAKRAKPSKTAARPATLADHHSAAESELITEINLARTRPDDYAAHLEQLKPFYSGREYKCPGGKTVVTQEGWGPSRRR